MFTADEKNLRNCAHWEHQCKNHPIFYLFNTDTNTVTNMNSGTDMDTGMVTAELSTGRMDPRVGSGHDFAGFWRVGSGQHFGFIIFSLIIYWYLNRYGSSNTTFGLIDFHRYLIYNNYLINK